MNRIALSICVALALAPLPVRAQSGLADMVAREEGVRAVKNLQALYGQYAQAGLWSEMAGLFVDKGEMIAGADDAKGRAAIVKYLRTQYGAGQEGIAKGGFQARLELAPVVNIAADGLSAKGRWHEVSLLGRGPGDAGWSFGIMENDYVKEQGVWKIARVDYHPMLVGSYADWWRNAAPDLVPIPYHYTPQSAGAPIGPLGDPVGAGAGEIPDALAKRVVALREEDKVRNLQNAYGYYLDRKMWDDITDMFSQDAVLEIAGQGLYETPANIRRALEIQGPAGLRHGEINDRLQVDEVIQVAPNGKEARGRGIEFGMIGQNHAKGYITVTVFENHYMMVNGTWRIREMRLFPNLKTDYTQGWGLSRITDGPAPPPNAPDKPTADTADSYPDFFAPNPATGLAVAWPAGVKVAARGDLVSWSPAPPVETLHLSLTGARVSLIKSIGYDAIENISSAFGNWIDDNQWPLLAALFTPDGVRKQPGVGAYVGPAHIAKAEEIINGVLQHPRTRTSMHMRTQPVIDFSPDGRTAKLRLRLFQPNSSFDQPGVFATAGMYEDSAALSDDGVWQLTNVQIDHIWRSPGYKQGWIDVPENFTARTVLPKILTVMPPDKPIKGVTLAPFPNIGPMWFHYRNPVSGRTPPDYWPD